MFRSPGLRSIEIGRGGRFLHTATPTALPHAKFNVSTCGTNKEGLPDLWDVQTNSAADPRLHRLSRQTAHTQYAVP